jgi:hypothetical protein
MLWARRAIAAPIAAIWLVCQGLTLVVVPVLLDASLAECVCPQGANATCPMHHKTASGPQACAMQSTTAGAPATLNALFSVTGLLPTLAQAMVLVPRASAALFESSRLTQRPSPPDPPPPRA